MVKRFMDIPKEFIARTRLAFRKESPCVKPELITIGITTFEARFERYFVPLLKKIREYVDNEIIVGVNGENNREFNEDYRKGLLQFLSEKQNVYPIVFPRFRGLSKLWNSIVIHSTNDYILMLNDDIMINSKDFIKDVCLALNRNQGRTFLINRSWSHFLINRDELDDLGYFDERLLGIGEEDGDMTWRYIDRYKREIGNYKIKGFENFAEDTVYTCKPVNIKTHSGTKYSLFNRKFMFEEKYQKVPNGIKGMFDQPVVMKDVGVNQYPNERFYRLRKGEL